jgi:hypothetical protein
MSAQWFRIGSSSGITGCFPLLAPPSDMGMSVAGAEVLPASSAVDIGDPMEEAL